MIPIKEVACKINIEEEELEYYGKFKAKVIKPLKEEKAEVILVTAMNPTPYGEGKTTVAIGLNDALNQLGKKSIATLREPSLGPVFGLKGGATGGNKAQVVPSADINLHFTGDFHAITSANNLIASVLDNSLYFGNKYEIDPKEIYFRRCLDINDRSLRNIKIQNAKINRIDHFNITAASEIMSIVCIAKDAEDVKNRIEDIVLAKKLNGNFLYVKELKITGAIMALLKDALLPNLVQSLEHNPVIIHGGPFANISTGISSVISLRMGRSLANYVVTEAGFGFDLGGYKFNDIICRQLNFSPKIVFVVTIRALKHHGFGKLEKGLENMKAHIDALNSINASFVVTINQFQEDTLEEINMVKCYLESLNADCIVNDVYLKGGKGALDLALHLTRMQKKCIKPLYALSDLLEKKIAHICENIMHSNKIIYTDEAKSKLKAINNLQYFVCIAKTPLSITDQADKLGYPKNETLTITDIHVYNGAKLIVVMMGNVLLMPGLPQMPNAENIFLDKFNQIQNLS